MLAHSLVPLLYLAATAIVLSSGKEKCCLDVGCFNDEGLFSHFPLPECPEDIDTKYYLFSQSTVNQPELTYIGIKPQFLHARIRTIFAVHGYMNSITTGWLQELKHILLSKHDVNLIIMDWKAGARSYYYPRSASTTRTTGAHLALLMDSLVSIAGIDYSDIWCLGFSLGAHVCGHAGMRTKSKIGRITGLDPAGPYFTGRDPLNGLNPSAAEFVDAIHTDGAGLALYYGMLDPRAHMDYYPNKGKHQPGCWTKRRRTVSQSNDTDDSWPGRELPQTYSSISCSHSRAIQLFVGSIEHPECHVARHYCNDPFNLPGSCVHSEDTIMGYHADRNNQKSGMFYLDTTSDDDDKFCRF